MRRSLLALAALAAAGAQTRPGGVEGTVVNALTGEPVARAQVTLAAKENRYWAAANAEGKFSVAAVEPGLYELRGERPGFLPFTDRVEVRPDMTLRPYAVKLMPESSIAGRVVDSNGQPMDGLSVVARGAGTAFQAKTDDRGEFRVERLPADRYRLLASPPRPPLPPEIRTDGTKELYFPDTWYAGGPIEVRAGAEVAAIEIRLAPAPMVRIGGVVIGGSLSPIRVVAEAVDDIDSLRSGIVDGSRFAVWNLPPGKHRIWARSGTLASAPVEIEMVSGDIEGIELSLMLPFPVTGRVEWDGAPLEDLSKLELGLAGDARSRRSPTLRVDAEGSVHAAAVEPDRYQLWTNAAAYVKAIYLGPNEMRDGLLDLSRGTGGAPVTIRLSTAVATVSGVARDARSSVRVELEPQSRPGRARHVETGKDGAYSFANLAPGSYRLSAPGYGSGTVEVREGDRAVRDLQPAR